MSPLGLRESREWMAVVGLTEEDVDCVEWPESSLLTPPSLLGDGRVRGPVCREEKLGIDGTQ